MTRTLIELPQRPITVPKHQDSKAGIRGRVRNCGIADPAVSKECYGIEQSSDCARRPADAMEKTEYDGGCHNRQKGVGPRIERIESAPNQTTDQESTERQLFRERNGERPCSNSTYYPRYSKGSWQTG